MAQALSNTPGKKRRGKRQPGLGHNLRLTNDERRALFLAHLNELRRLADAVNDAKELAKPALAAVKVAASARRKASDAARDNGFNPANLERYLAELRRSPAGLQASANQERLERTWAGLPHGLPVHPKPQMQLEMDALRDYRAEGRRAGLMGEPGLPPEGVVGDDMQQWMTGWGEGQSEIAWALDEQTRIAQMREFEGRPAEEAPQPAPQPANDNVAAE